MLIFIHYPKCNACKRQKRNCSYKSAYPFSDISGANIREANYGQSKADMLSEAEFVMWNVTHCLCP